MKDSCCGIGVGNLAAKQVINPVILLEKLMTHRCDMSV